ncbi:MAG: DMT family transporter [Devosia sp.]|uniref:DMT family transporter n=1 Tax=Devosia sp. TaxID=1871048 RepID=UPI001ACD8D43|nr:DMT family transporter [Devosia sp.]MBN9317939.1 DMT family transporter [Devosia sp.]
MTSTIAPVEERRSLGIGLLLFAQLFFATLDTSAKYLSFIGLPLGEIVFIRYAVHVVLAVALFLPLQRDLFRTRNWRLELLRGLCLLGVTGANFLAQRFLPLTVTGALMFTMPLMVTALSGPFLGETIGWRRWMAVGIGFVGILIIVRPGTEAFHPASLICLAGALSAAFYSIITRKLAGVDSAATQQVYSGIIALACITPFAFSNWVWPTSGGGWFAFIAIGITGMIAHQLNTIAHRFAPPSALAPFSYTELLLLALASWLIFAEPPDAWFYLGAPIIIGSGIYIWFRERQLNRQITVDQVED